MKAGYLVAAILGSLALAAWGCSAGSSAADGPFAPGSDIGGGAGSNASSSGGAGFGGGAADAAAALPPETKTESNYQAPVSTGQIVWTANPVSGRVAYIDVTTFAVQTVQAGSGPTYIAAVPDANDDIAIVLNVLSQDATLLDRNRATGALTTKTFSSTANANAWAISPSGRWAIAWTDATRVSAPDPTQGFQDIAVIDTQRGLSTTLAVGYRPSLLAFSGDEGRAFAVTQDGISVVALGDATPAVSQNFALSAPTAAPDASAPEGSPEGAAMDATTSDASEPDATPDATADATFDAGTDAGRVDGSVASAAEAGASRAGDSSATPTNAMPDVSFTPDGSYALVRQQGIAAISVVSLVDGSATRVDLPVAPTDLTISPDGAFAVAVLRDTSSVAILPLPAIATDPTAYTTTTIAGETIGRALVTTVASAGPPSILLFTTASPVERMTTLTLGPTPSYRTIPLHAPVLAVFPTDDGRYAIVLHSVSPSSGTVKGAFSVVPIADPLPGVIVSLAAPPTAVAIATDRALVALRDDTTSTYGVDLAMMPSLHVTSFGLASPPIAVGIAAATATGYVAQNYSEGRITFIDLDAGATRTITGFELGARVVTGNGQ